jgi:hypothetical protein
MFESFFERNMYIYEICIFTKGRGRRFLYRFTNEVPYTDLQKGGVVGSYTDLQKGGVVGEP